MADLTCHIYQFHIGCQNSNGILGMPRLFWPWKINNAVRRRNRGTIDIKGLVSISWENKFK